MVPPFCYFSECEKEVGCKYEVITEKIFSIQYIQYSATD